MLRPRHFAAVLLAFAAAGCASTDKKSAPPINPMKQGLSDRELRLEAGQLYKQARRALDSSDFSNAITRYDQLQTKYPFSDYATQAQLEEIYARYRNFDADEAVSGADRFLKEHPRHPEVQYVYYIRGLVNFQRGDSLFDSLPFYDPTKPDVGYARKSFDDFALLIQRYPDSQYGGDARQRMIYLRNRLAQHDMGIVRFYLKRGAWLAAAKRCEDIIAQYPGAPATDEALQYLEHAYREMGMKAQADDARRVLAANQLKPLESADSAPEIKPNTKPEDVNPPALQPQPERDESAVPNPG